MKPIVYGVEFAARAQQKSEYAVEWEIYELDGVGLDGVPYYAVHGADDYGTTDITQAKPWASMAIKWDGCSHLYFNDEGYFHVCGYDNWTRFNEMIANLFHRSQLIMESKGVTTLDDGSFPE